MKTLINLFKNINLWGFWSDRSRFYRDLANSLKEDELIDTFIDGELKIASDPKTSNKSRIAGLKAFKQAYSYGSKTIGEALSKVMPASDSLFLSSLDNSPNVVVTLNELANAIDKQNAMKRVVWTALITPLVMIPVSIIFISILALQTIPAFVESAPEQVWKDSYNYAVRVGAEWLSQYGLILLLIAVVAILWTVFWALANLKADWRYKMENSKGWRAFIWFIFFPLMPLFKIYRDVQGTLMLSSLATLMLNKMLLKNAIATLELKAQPWMRKHLSKCLMHLNHYPNDTVAAFSYGILPKFLLARMATKTRQARVPFEQTLIDLGTHGIEESQHSVKITVALFNAGILILLGGMIVFFYAGILSITISNDEAQSASVNNKSIVRKVK